MRSLGLLAMTVVLVLVLTALSREAAALDIDNIMIFQGTDRINGVVQGYFFEVEVEGTGILNGRIVQETTGGVPTGREFTLTNGTDWDYDNDFSSWTQMLAIHPDPVHYHFHFNEALPSYDHVIVSFAIAPPSGFATITYPLHDATGVSLNPNYQWDNVEGYGDVMGMWVVDAGSDIYEDVPVTDMTRTDWQPGSLPGGTYEIEVSVGQMVGGGVLDLQMQSGDGFKYLGVFEEINWNEFSTVPEPATIALLGTAMLVFIGLRRRYRMR